MNHILEMKYPASWWRDLWREGLPTGNGFTGANLYGGAKREILQLGRHDFWINGKQDELPDVHESLEHLREKMDNGEFKEAGWEIVNQLKEKGYSSKLEEQIPVARMIVEQQAIEGFQSFRRYLDMKQGEAVQQWVDAGIRMRREVFVSRKDDLVVYRLAAENEAKEQLSYRISLEAYKNEGEKPTDAMQWIWDHAEQKVVLFDAHTAYCYFHSSLNEKCQNNDAHQNLENHEIENYETENHGFGAVAKITISEGELKKGQNWLDVSTCADVLIKIALYSAGDKEQNWSRLQQKLERSQESFKQMLKESAELHKRLYYSAKLQLGEWNKEKRQEVAQGHGSEKAQEQLLETKQECGHSNEELLLEAFSEKQSTELIEKLWHFGRYLFICGTNPKANPFALYGLWGGTHHPMWCHNMANENLQMIYWHSMCGNLLEYNQAVFRYMNDKIPAFYENAKKLFGIDGIYMTAGTTPGVSNPTQVVPVIINWVSASGWIAQHYYQYFQYTKDWDFAANVMAPYMDGVAKFYEQFVRFTEQDGKKRIRFYPSVSPENTPVNFMPPDGVQMAHPMPTTINSTIDLAILKEFFTNLTEFSQLLREKKIQQKNQQENQQKNQGSIQFDESRIQAWQEILDAIPEFKCNSDGAIREWQEKLFEDRYEHRHLSHIYPVFPGHELHYRKDADQLEPYKKAVKLRKIDAQTGWSMAHMAAINARLGDGKAAMKCLDHMAKSCLIANFFTLHNDWRGMNLSLTLNTAPVQLDALMGYVNALQEMLLYSVPGFVALLPALEERLYQGEVKHFRYAEGLLSMRWDVNAGRLWAKFAPDRPHELSVALPSYVEHAEWVGTEAVNVGKGVWKIRLDHEEVICQV